MSNREWPGAGYVLPITEENLKKLGFQMPAKFNNIYEMCEDYSDIPDDCPIVKHIKEKYGFTPELMYIDDDYTIDAPLEYNTWILIFGETDKYDKPPCQNWLNMTNNIKVELQTWTVFG